jgi:hypothetical protein
MRDAGVQRVSGRRRLRSRWDGGYAYFDTQRDLGVIVEAVDPPSRMLEPDRIWQP